MRTTLEMNTAGDASSNGLVSDKQPILKVSDFEKAGLSDKIQTLNLFANALVGQLSRKIMGQNQMLEALAAAAVIGKNVALIGPSASGKTKSVKLLGSILKFRRRMVPMTPEITDSDITGSVGLNSETQEKIYWHGPFIGDTDEQTQLVFVDEINRASPKAMSAFLHPLEENNVIIDGTEYPLTKEFTFIAAMNPPDADGTNQLISALIDRFDYFLNVPQTPLGLMPNILEEIYREDKSLYSPFDSPKEITRMIIAARRAWKRILYQALKPSISEANQYACGPFWNNPKWPVGATPRTFEAIFEMATFHAVFHRSALPTPDDVWQVAPGCLGMSQHHDLRLDNQGRIDKITEELEAAERTYRSAKRAKGEVF